MPSPQTLHYGPALPLHKRRSFRRAIALLVILFLGIGAAIWGPTLGRWTQTMYWQRRCMDCTLPLDRVVFESDIGGAQTVTDQTMNHLVSGLYGVDNSYFGGQSAFLHRMQRPDGQERLVWVRIEFKTDIQGIPNADCQVDTWIPGRLYKMPNFSRSTESFARFSFKWKSRFMAGQIDPQNPNHLTINYEQEGKQYIIDGWLNNQDELLISERP